MTAGVVFLVLFSVISRGSAVFALFIPMALNYFWLSIIDKFPPLKSFYPTGMALTLSLTTLWLYSVVTPRRHPIIRIITALIIFALFGIATYYSSERNDYWYRNVLFPYYFLLSIAIIAALVFSGIRCRKRFTNRRFVLYLLFWIFIFNFLVLTGDILYHMKYTGFPISYALIITIFPGCLLTTIISFLLVLPFVIISFRNALLRNAMMSVLGLTKNITINDD